MGMYKTLLASDFVFEVSTELLVKLFQEGLEKGSPTILMVSAAELSKRDYDQLDQLIISIPTGCLRSRVLSQIADALKSARIPKEMWPLANANQRQPLEKNLDRVKPDAFDDSKEKLLGWGKEPEEKLPGWGPKEDPRTLGDSRSSGVDVALTHGKLPNGEDIVLPGWGAEPEEKLPGWGKEPEGFDSLSLDD